MVIAITGIGVVSALGVGREENCKRLAEGRGGVREMTSGRSCHREWPVGEVTGKLGAETMTRNVLLGALALREAVEDAKLTTDECKNTPLVNGSTVGGMDITEEHYGEWMKERRADGDQVRQHEVDFTTRELVRLCGLSYGVTISTACSSALNAVIRGAGLLRSGRTSRVVVGGTEALTRFHLNGFAALGVLSRSICRPFEEDRDGINLGEGAAFVVLEDAVTAERRGAKVYGYLAGYGNACDAFHQTASSPEGDGAFEAMRQAVKMAGIEPQEVDYVNAHGTATQNNDSSEMRAFERLFGENMPCVESTKPLTGHTTSASGGIETVFSLSRMEERGYDCVMCNAFAFGGNDSSVVISRRPVSFNENDTLRYDNDDDDPSIGLRQSYRSEALSLSSSSSSSSSLSLDYKPYIPATEARRMTRALRQLVAVAFEALHDSGITVPDGIVVGTRFGAMVPTIQLLNHLAANGERDFSPTLFMNSTHNCAATTLARMIGCKGYNNTVVTSGDTFAAAMEDARLALGSFEGMRSVLVCAFDEVPEEWNELLGEENRVNNEVKAQVIWLD